MCTGLLTIICAVTSEAIRYGKFISTKSNSLVNINRFRFSALFAVDVPIGIMTPQFIFQAIAECLVLITSKSDSQPYVLVILITLFSYVCIMNVWFIW